MRNCYWGIDIGSVSLNIVGIDDGEEIVHTHYQRTHGRVVESVKEALEGLRVGTGGFQPAGCCTTGSGRELVAALVNADLVKNEISTHAVAALKKNGSVRTVIEIGGEDSKMIVFKNGIPVDFTMNTMCAAGTGAFLDQLASRLNIGIEDLGALALDSRQDVAIAGRCTVFAESDIIFKQQLGHRLEDIVMGLCRSLVRNYLNDNAKGKAIEAPVFFQGGVAANAGIRKAFEEALDTEITVPEHFNVMGAYGAALMVKREFQRDNRASSMKHVDDIIGSDFRTGSFKCEDCPNCCEIVRFMNAGTDVGHLGGRCGKWETINNNARSLQ